eukprot:scaffold69577_cov80-Phaeocystis_antarctica.AAC.1
MADGVPCSRHMSCLGGHGRVGQVSFSLRNAPLPSSPKLCHARAPRRRFDTAHTRAPQAEMPGRVDPRP